MMKAISSLEKKNIPWAYAFIAPSILIFLLFYLAPIVTVLTTSFTRWDGYNSPVFNSFDNYRRFFTQSSFLISLSNLLKWSVIAGTVHVGFGVLVAFLLFQQPRGWKVVRAVYMFPNIISAAAMAMIFRFVFNNDFGILNGLIRIFKPDFQINWFFQSPYAFIAITLTWVFYAVIVTLLVLGDLLAIPGELYDAARIDGASKTKLFVYIQLPLCRYSIGTGVILSIIGRVTMYEPVALTTRGGPGDDTMNITIILVKAITDMNYGLANAASTFMIGLGIITLLAVNRIFNMGESVY